ncbi:NAD(P)-binding domain-containing protein [Burkholderia sp. 3C]
MSDLPNPDRDALDTLRLAGPDPENWVPDRPGIDHNVLIVGGGQSGAAYAYGLRRAGIGRVSVIDAAPDASQAGVWLTRARMRLLRTPKTLVGPEAGLPGLGFRAWHDAQYGEAAFDAFERIPRERWAEYLAWYRTFLRIPIRYGVTLARIEPAGDHFRVHLRIRDANGERDAVETTRKVILANGVAGNGRPNLPPVLAALPATHRAHTADAIDFAALRGKRVAVIGGAASAFDAAATALEAGAAAVHLFVRRTAIASLPVSRARAYPGAYDNYPSLPDALRWQLARRFRQAGSTPPPDAVERVTRHDAFHLHLGGEWTAARLEHGEVVAEAAGERFAFDFVIAGTGYAIDLHARPELADFADEVLLWRDRHQPDAADRDDALGAHPYLGRALEYLERTPGAAPYLRHIHAHNPAGFVSFGVPVGDVPCMKRDIPAVIARISEDLFTADLAAHAARMASEVPADFPESAYAHRVWQGAAASADAAAA